MVWKELFIDRVGTIGRFGRWIGGLLVVVLGGGSLLAAAIYFFVVAPYTALVARSRKEPPADPTTKKCPECLSEIPIDARRCAFCGEPQPA